MKKTIAGWTLILILGVNTVVRDAPMAITLEESIEEHPIFMVIGQGISVSINDFGAIPDDNKDDTIAIRKALAINGSITMNRGIYNVHGIIRLDKETSIEGNGSTFLSRLDKKHIGQTSKNILTLKGNRIVIKNLILDGAYGKGNAKEGKNVSSLLHIYDSKNIILENLNSINHVSNWWSPKEFNFSKLNLNHRKDMYSVIYIGFSDNISINNMEQKGNIKTEGLLLYESDNIRIDGFKSFNSSKIWTSLNIIASNNIILNNIYVADGKENQKGSSINFIANHHFVVKNTKTTTKQGFDISNEVTVKGLNSRVMRDTSYGIFENCYFKGERALYAYPTINKVEDVVFKNTTFIPTKEGFGTWSVRIEKAGKIKFKNCIFGSKRFKTFGIILGDSREVLINNCQFINPSMGLYFFGKNFGKINLSNNTFKGENYSPIVFFSPKSYNIKGKARELYLNSNRVIGQVPHNRLYTLQGGFKIERIIK